MTHPPPGPSAPTPPPGPSRNAAVATAVKCPQCLESMAECCGRHKAGEACSQYCDVIRKTVAAAPPLSPEQSLRIAALLSSADETAAERPRFAVPQLPPMPRLPSVAPAPAERPAPSPVLAGVYFVRTRERIKIGMSTNVDERLKALSTMCPTPLELLAVVEGAHAEESQLHRRFAHLRLHGEWFRAETELLAFIDSLGFRKEAAS